jgi:hypothetical protein
MNERLDELKKAYRDIAAPPHLATRIRAEVGDRPIRRRAWIPAGATTLAVLALAFLAPYIAQQSATTTSVPNKPSLVALATLKPDKPAGTPTSLSRVRSVTRPKMPAKPRPDAQKPQTKLDTETEFLKENDHALS